MKLLDPDRTETICEPSRLNFSLIGFLAGMAAPSFVVAYELVRSQIERNQHPLGPNVGGCGLSALAPILMIPLAMVTAPIFGAMGAAFGWAVKEIVSRSHLDSD